MLSRERASRSPQMFASFPNTCSKRVSRGGELNVADYFSRDYVASQHAGFRTIPDSRDAMVMRAFIASMFGPQLKRLVSERIATEAGTRLLLAPEERAARLAELASKERAASIREEIIISAMERASLDVARRPDADPAIVLAL